MFGFASAILCLSLAGPMAAAPNGFEGARQLLLHAYPELAEHDTRVSIPLALRQSWSAPLRSLTVIVYGAEWRTPAPADLVAVFEQDDMGRLRAFSAGGPLVHSDRLNALIREIDRAPTLQNTAIAERLRRLGTVAPPGTDTGHILRRTRLESLLGPFRVQSAVFEYRSDADDAQHREARLVWRLRVNVGSGEFSGTYDLTFEPFGGRLVAMVRIADELLFAAGTAAPAGAQGDALEQARQLIRLAYPGLVGQDARVMIPLSLDQSWIANRIPRITLLVYRPGHQGPGPSDLVVHYHPDGEGRPKIMVATGPYVGFDRWAALRAEVSDNPDWSDAAIRSRLETAGAKFASISAPELLRAVNVERFRPLLGDFRIIDASFTLRTEAEDPSHRMAILEWTVRTELPRGSRVPGYAFVYEPFTGQLVAIRQLTDTRQ